HQVLGLSLSDIAAMGARPIWSLISFGIPRKDWDGEFRDELFAGYLDLADRYSVTLVGGDVSKSKQVVVDSIVVGEVNSGCAVLRSTARAGDQIFVTGTLGGAAAGLKLIGNGARVDQRSDIRDQRSESRLAGIAGGPRGSSPTVREGLSVPPAAAGGSVGQPGRGQMSDDAAIDALLL